MGRPNKKIDSSSSAEESDQSNADASNVDKISRVPGETLSIVLSKEEEEFRKEAYPDVEKVKREKLNCTVCDKIIGPFILNGHFCYLHSALEVLVCKDCQTFYGDGNFSVDEEGDDKYCRWCAQGGNLFICDKCHCSFCKKCVKKNLSRALLTKMDEANDWQCFICEPSPLYSLRAKAWAAHEVYLKNKSLVRRKQKKNFNSSRKSDSSDSESDDKIVKRSTKKSNGNSSDAVSDDKRVKRSTKKNKCDSEDESEEKKSEKRGRDRERKVKTKKKEERNRKESVGGGSSRSSSLSSVHGERKYVKIGMKFLNDILKELLGYCQEVSTKTEQIQSRYVNKKLIKNTESVINLGNRIKNFLQTFQERTVDLQDRLDDSLEAFKNLIEIKSDSGVNNSSLQINGIDKIGSDKVPSDTNEVSDKKSASEEEVKNKLKPNDVTVIEDSDSKNDSNSKVVLSSEEEKDKKKDSSEEENDKRKDNCEEENDKRKDSSEDEKAKRKDSSKKERDKRKDSSEEEKDERKKSSEEENAKRKDSSEEENDIRKDSSEDENAKRKDSSKEENDKRKDSSKNKKDKRRNSSEEEEEKRKDSGDEGIKSDDNDMDCDNTNNKLEDSDKDSDALHVADDVQSTESVKIGDNEIARKDLLASSASEDEDKIKTSEKRKEADSDEKSSDVSSINIDTDEEPELKKKKKLTKKTKKSEPKDNANKTKLKKRTEEETEDTDEEIRRLANLKTLKRKRESKKSDEDGDNSDNQEDECEDNKKDSDEHESKKKKSEEKISSEKKKKNILDSLEGDSDSSQNEDPIDEKSAALLFDDDDIFNFVKKVENKPLSGNEMMKQALLLETSSSSSLSELDSEGSKLLSKFEQKSKKKNKDVKSDDEKEKEVKKEDGTIDKDDEVDDDDDVKMISEAEESEKSKKTEDLKKEVDSSGKSSEEGGSGNESEDIFAVKPKSKWRRNKHLIGKLSDTDSCDEEKKKEKWRKQKEKEKDVDDSKSSGSESEEKLIRKKKVRRRRIMNSDSDEVKISLSSDDSDSSVAIVKSKKKRKKGSSSSVVSVSSEDDKSKKKRKRIKAPVESSTNSDDDNDAANASQSQTDGKGRKNIRKVIKDDYVAEATKSAAKEEEERRQRIAERQRLYNKIYEVKDSDDGKIEKLVLDFDPETKEELVVVDKDLVAKMKPHQANGVKFMWDTCFESVERLKKKDPGTGCIIAHCMGLGKTFQVICLIHTLLTHEVTNVKRVLVVCPLSTVLNWYAEFQQWLKDIGSGNDVELFHLAKDKQIYARQYRLEDWYNTGGVMIMGYEMFRILSNENAKNFKKKQKEVFKKTLWEGPDLVICDEGHMLKNEATALSKAMNKLKTRRRIVLTGTPLQNNLIEYHCMVQFVRPSLLGTKKEFSNRFVNPITNGQFVDSTERDFKIMKRRAHVLHKLLEGLVQRCDYNVLTPYLPPKQEYVLSIRLTEIQIKLYRLYLDKMASLGNKGRVTLLADFQGLSRIWSHPLALKFRHEKDVEKKLKEEEDDSEGSLRDFVVDSSGEESTTTPASGSNSDSSVSVIKEKEKPKRMTRANKKDLGDDCLVEAQDNPEVGLQDVWWSDLLDPDHFESISSSSKLILLFAILKECELIGDKVLVFSQSLYSLDLIEHFLSAIDEATDKGDESSLLCGHTGTWARGLDYFRLDGSTSSENRTAWIKSFNRESNIRARLFLISTRAGGLGINLTAANRVIIFDASWNPSYDVQSIFRIYRFGQKKPCYIYRFIAQGTMEEKVYERQVAKLSLSQRVVDEQQVNRYFSHSDLQELYNFTPAEKKNDTIPMLPKDRLMAELLQQHGEWIHKCHEHDSLLDHVEEEELNEEERKAAWDDFENEKKRGYALPNTKPTGPNFFDPASHNAMMNSVREAIRVKYPKATPDQVAQIENNFIRQIYKDQPQNYQIYLRNLQIQQQQILWQQQIQQQHQQMQQQKYYAAQLQSIAAKAGGNANAGGGSIDQTYFPQFGHQNADTQQPRQMASSSNTPTMSDLAPTLISHLLNNPDQNKDASGSTSSNKDSKKDSSA